MVLTVAVILCAKCVGQDLITDRPDQTESASIVPQHHLQWEAGTMLEINGLQEDWTILTNLFRYGVSNKLELRLVTELINTEISSGRSINGLSDMQIGLKYKLVDGPVEVAYLGHLVVPNGSISVSTRDWGTVNRINIAHDLGENWSSGINVGYELFEGGSNGNLVYTWAIGATLTDRLGYYLELFGGYEEFEEWIHNFDTGFTYLLKDNLQFDFSIGTGLTKRSNFYSFVFSWRIPY